MEIGIVAEEDVAQRSPDGQVAATDQFGPEGTRRVVVPCTAHVGGGSGKAHGLRRSE